MTPMAHREAGIAGTVLDDERVMCELICDGGHICPTVLRNAFKILGESRAVVISDSMRGAGLGEGEFELGGQAVFVSPAVNMPFWRTERLPLQFQTFTPNLKILLDLELILKQRLNHAQ